MEIPLNTSAVLVLMVALLLGGSFLHARRRWSVLNAREASPASASPRLHARMLIPVRRPLEVLFRERGDAKRHVPVQAESTTPKGPAGVRAASGSQASSPFERQLGRGSGGQLRARRRLRAALALFGVAALLVGLVTSVLGIVSVVPGWVPALALAAVVVSVSALRAMARTREGRLSPSQNALSSRVAERVPPKPQVPAPVHPPLVSTAPPKGDTHTHTTVNSTEQPPAPDVSDTDTPFDVQAVQEQKPTDTVTAEPEEASPAPALWEPSQVPPSVYMQAPKATQRVLEPVEVSAAPQPSHTTSIKADQRQRAQSAAEPTIKGQLRQGKKGPQADLDNVLQRRRA